MNLLTGTDISVTFWVLAAVTLNIAAPPPPSPWARSLIGRFLPLFVAVPLAAAFLVLIAYPGIAAANHVWHARLMALGYPAKLKAVERAEPYLKNRARGDARQYIDQSILRPLADAVRANPDDAGPLLEQVPWWLAEWELGGLPATNANALTLAFLAQARDPEGLGGYLAQFQVCLRLAELSPQRRKEQMEEAEAQIREVVKRDPARAARLRFQVARVWFAVKEVEKGKAAAEAARQLDADAPGPRYRLGDDERAQVRRWLGAGGDKSAR
jgi:hypothetical protein